ncbi:type II toxin-antitoxin system Phd/YefM family antitoxin [Actinomyces sp. ZJ308]|uniref:type II toxin-antitoxin system Phd/YefM family antitoxin n=1 Tax=Actinomyces sp. ZJ308 TaxID=2708342 RepID=UPI0014226D75|nr:type II toxin-antitoxin system Phd/YefM family antitoxin [Actinomyces sp. ZJ308]
MSAAGTLVSAGARTVGLREVNQQAGRVYREVESSGVPVTVTDHGRPIAQIVPIRDDESWYQRMVREGKVSPARREWVLPASGWEVPEDLDLEDVLLGERQEDR